jgi:hypothetical protein
MAPARSLRPVWAFFALAVALLWSIWHAPRFAILAGYAGLGPFTIVGFLADLAAGSIVLTSIDDGTGGSVLSAAVWHALSNVAAASAAADGAVAAVVTAGVVTWAVSLVQRARAGLPGLGPR